MKCPECGTNNGITFYVGKKCKRCGINLVIDTELNKMEDNEMKFKGFKEWKKKEFFEMAEEEYEDYLTEKLWKFIKGEQVRIDFETDHPESNDGILTIKMKLRLD